MSSGLTDIMDTESLFPEIHSSSDSAYSGSIKSEPPSPCGPLPPSPSSSDSDGRRDSPPPSYS